MSRTPEPRHAVGAQHGSVDTTASPETLLELLSDDYVREFLAAIREEAKPARQIAEECDTSRPTAYRRLNRLCEAGLVTERMEYEADGHHRRTFSAAVDRVAIELGESGFEAAVTPVDSPTTSRS